MDEQWQGKKEDGMTRGEGTGVARALCDLKLQWEEKKEENENEN
jgi:hypothetical protein